jgi:hypothetical protein
LGRLGTLPSLQHLHIESPNDPETRRVGSQPPGPSISSWRSLHIQIWKASKLRKSPVTEQRNFW